VALHPQVSRSDFRTNQPRVLDLLRGWIVTRFWYPETNSLDWKSWKELIPRFAIAAVFVVMSRLVGFVDEQFYVILRTINLL